jgi:hypothetical protein
MEAIVFMPVRAWRECGMLLEGTRDDGDTSIGKMLRLLLSPHSDVLVMSHYD